MLTRGPQAAAFLTVQEAKDRAPSCAKGVCGGQLQLEEKDSVHDTGH